MKFEKFKRLKSFLIFNLPINYAYIFVKLQRIHRKQQLIYPKWPITSTRSMMIAEYWFNTFVHYATLISLCIVLQLMFYSDFSLLSFSIIAFYASLLYLPLYFIVYRPTFIGGFLPQLENVVASFENKERSWLEKCKLDQPSNRALVFIFYAFDKCAKLNFLSPNDKCADQLHILFGVSTKGIKNELDLIFKKQKRQKMGYRLTMEVAKSFEEAFILLEDMQFDEGIKRLKELELQFKQLD